MALEYAKEYVRGLRYKLRLIGIPVNECTYIYTVIINLCCVIPRRHTVSWRRSQIKLRIIMLEKEEFSFQGRKTKKKMERSFWEKEEFLFVKKDDKEKLWKNALFRDLPTDTRHCYTLEMAMQFQFMPFHSDSCVRGLCIHHIYQIGDTTTFRPVKGAPKFVTK